MSVIRVNKTKNYTVMSNTHLREHDMSLKAKGLLSVMLSLPDNWDYSISGLCKICTEKESAIKSTLKELKKFGYLIVTKIMPDKSETGRIEYIYNIYESPIAEKQAVEKQGVENQGVEFQSVENPIQINTNKPITKKEITNKEIYNTVVSFLNEKAGMNYKASSKATQRHINARIDEGYKVEDFKTVIEKKCAEWIGTEFEKYLRPETLFGAKFDRYLNEKPKAAQQPKKQYVEGVDYF